MEFEYYPHQHKRLQKQKQQQEQKQRRQVDTNSSMAATNINTTASTTTGNSNTNNTNNNNISSSNNTNNSSSTSSSINSTTHTLTANSSAFGSTTADAATVAIAKDMLQLHHGGTINNNNNNNVTDGAHSSPTNIVIATTMTMANTPPIASTTTTTTSLANLSNNNNPPASAINSVITTGGVSATANIAPPPENALGLLRFNEEVLYITDPITVIGRNSSTSMVHFHVAENNLVSRKHFQVVYDTDTRDFLVQCLSKNGIFVDDFLQRRNAEPLNLPPRCYFRFPSTEIRIQFESFLPSSVSQHSGVSSSGVSQLNHNSNHSANMSGNAHVIIAPTLPEDVHQSQPHQHPHQQQQQHQHHHHNQQQHLLPPNLAQQQQQQSMQQQHPHPHHQSQSHPQRSSATGIQQGSAAAHILPIDSGNAIYSPLKISIPKKEQKSPYLSPTGTISAANSCPASPRQGFPQGQPGYNNYSNNNLQNQDLFQTPSTASYNHNEKPPYSYAQLIVQAISAAPDKQLTLSGIYSFIVKHYPYYRKETNKGWQNSIRHNLSLNRYFIKVARSQDEPGKGSFWRIDPDSGAKLIDHSYKKRRQRSSQGFRPPYGMPRSAPVSPSHMDNSRESSPLQDIVLQSAPGSPGISLENRAAEGDIIYNSQNAHQQTLANNSHQYSSGSPYYVTNQNAGAGQQQSHADSSSGGGGNHVGALMALKRNHVMTAGGANLAIQQLQQQPIQQQHQQQQQQQQQQQSLHPDIIYDDMPTDYSGHMETDDDACDAKRPKYVPEVL